MSQVKKSKISEMDKKYFREIFNLYSDNGKIGHKGLMKIFEMVDFKPNQKQDQEFEALFVNKADISFNEFLQIFSSKSNNQFKEIDIKNAFRLLSKQYDRPGWIKLERLKEILAEMGLKDLDIIQLINQLQSQCDKDGMFNFEDFVKSAF